MTDPLVRRERPEWPRHRGRDGAWYPEPSEAKLAVVLGLIGMFIFPLVAPFAWAVGARELRAISAERRPPEDRQLAQIGRALGMIMSIALIVFSVIVFGLIGYSLAT